MKELYMNRVRGAGRANGVYPLPGGAGGGKKPIRNNGPLKPMRNSGPLNNGKLSDIIGEGAGEYYPGYIKAHDGVPDPVGGYYPGYPPKKINEIDEEPFYKLLEVARSQ